MWKTDLQIELDEREQQALKQLDRSLEGKFQLLLANAAHIKNVPGRKTDVKDAEWIVELLRRPPRFSPPRSRASGETGVRAA